jgi:hypothetical protein
MSNFFYTPIFVALSDSGAPLPGAKLTFWQSGTTTPSNIYADAGLTTPLSNPVIANAAGVFPSIYLDDSVTYRVKLETSAGVLRWDVDPYECLCAGELVEIPTITSLDPPSTLFGGSDFTLTVHGTNYIADSVVRWNGEDRVTTFISSTELEVAILEADIATTGTATVRVFNPDGPGGALSNEVDFQVIGAFFASDLMNRPGWSPQVWPSAIYNSGEDTTYAVWIFIGAGPNKGVHVAAFDHATDLWSERYTLGNYNNLPNDSRHGHPAIVQDGDGYLYSFFGNHNSDQHWSVSNAPNDISAWTQQAPISSGDYTYPHPVLVGSAIYLFMMDRLVTSRHALSLVTGTPSAGSVSFSAPDTIVDFGADSRVWQMEAHAVGTDIHFVASRSDGNDVSRHDAYYFIYDTTTGDVSNFDESATIASGDLPVDLTEANADFRIFDNGMSDGGALSFQFDSNGDPHVLVADAVGGGEYEVKHIFLDGGAWTSPETIATVEDASSTTGFVTVAPIVPGASGTMQAWYNLLGDKVRRVRSAAGVWGDPEIIASPTVTDDFLGGTPVLNAHSDFRTTLAEWTEGSLNDADAEMLPLWGYGDSGFVREIDMSVIDPDWQDVSLLLGFEHNDAATTIIDDSQSTRSATLVGTAQIDTAQKKFGNGSLRLDGSGDYVTYADDDAFDLDTGDAAIEAWIRRADTGRAQGIVTKRGSGPTGWSFSINDTDKLIFFAEAGSLVVGIASAASMDTTGVWHHVAVTREGSTWRIFIDGNLENSANQTGAPSANNSVLSIGRDGLTAGREFDGWMDEVRFTKGAARYTATFTPPDSAFPRR